ncbi:hypothetical protein LX99_01169 [Mucilaginibacter oryzae]|uniref:Uncharacterized protein n=1 Tax=Mucilaginibacter oryzae TaxID=468058 RepID=A0A316HF98_9SPHI|nr:hypothetical protein [Mucilaginibacter oryzae]PWK78721.1 hypothetical protein LX99_01169 [Mucilaginibacter oryzae]
MKPFFIDLPSQGLHLIILPETEPRMDGHPVITYSYHIFRRGNFSSDGSRGLESPILLMKKEDDPNYLGHINYEQPGIIFNYIADGAEVLSRTEVEAVIDEINRYRKLPRLWL